MDFDSRWNDDPRERDDYGRELSQGSRGGLSNPREREPLDARDVFTRDLELPRGPDRERVWARDSDVRLRGSEVRTLATVGAFRVVPAGDLRDGQDRRRPARGDLRHLKDSGLVETIPPTAATRPGRAHRTRPRRARAQPWSSVHREELKWAAVEREFDNRSDVDDERPDIRTKGRRNSTSASGVRATLDSPCTGRGADARRAGVSRLLGTLTAARRRRRSYSPRHPRSRAETPSINSSAGAIAASPRAMGGPIERPRRSIVGPRARAPGQRRTRPVPHARIEYEDRDGHLRTRIGSRRCTTAALTPLQGVVWIQSSQRRPRELSLPRWRRWGAGRGRRYGLTITASTGRAVVAAPIRPG